MTGSDPVLDLGVEAAGSPWQMALVIGLALGAFGWLVWRTVQKRRRTLAGDGCGTCAGCRTQGGACRIGMELTLSPEHGKT